jgi:hypothetical protein
MIMYDVAIFVPGRRERLAGSPDDEHALDARGLRDGSIRHRLEIDPRTAAQESVRRDEQPGLAIDQAGRDRRCRVAREDRREDRADPADCKDRDHGLGQHREQDPDSVALAHPELA